MPALLAFLLLAQAAASTQPSDLTLPPETAQLVTIVEGRGVQIYTCASGAKGPVWLFQAPEAQLVNLATSKPVGHHDAGPTWTLDDGSSIQGAVFHDKAAGNPADVPWLLLKTRPANPDGGVRPGELTTVTYVRRYNTHGGVAPATGCAAAQLGQTLRVPYTATYAFYSTPGAPSYVQTTPAVLPPPPPPPSAPPPPPPAQP